MVESGLERVHELQLNFKTTDLGNGGEEQVRRAYKKMSLLSHPDKTGGSTEQFIKVNEAYQELLLIC